MAIPIFERWGLNAREQRVATIAVYVFGVALLLLVPVGVQTLVASRRADNEELRNALVAVNGARGQLRERQARKDAIVARYRNKAPPLAGFIEQRASAQKLQVVNSFDRPEVTSPSKRYVERHTQISLKKSGMLAIAKFMEAIETSGHPVTVSQLKLRKRGGENDSFDVEMGLSAFDRTEPPKEEKPKEPEPKK